MEDARGDEVDDEAGAPAASTQPLVTSGGSESRPTASQTIQPPSRTSTTAFASAASTRPAASRSSAPAWRAERQPGGEEREPERERVGEHVRRVGQQGERSGSRAGDRLDAREPRHEPQRERERLPLSAVCVHAGTVTRRVCRPGNDPLRGGGHVPGSVEDLPDGTRAVNDLNLEIEDGEFLVLVGPSGCGKTTALRMVPASRRSRRGSSGSATDRQPRPLT